MKKSLLLFVVSTIHLVVFIPLNAQMQIKGKIVDDLSLQAIEGVNISYLGNRGTISNGNGEFDIHIGRLPVILHFSHIGYNNKQKTIQSDSASSFTLKLTKKTSSIPVVEILGSRLKRFMEDRLFYVIDYEFIDNNIIAIGFENNVMWKGRVALINLQGDTLDWRPVNNPKKLYRDALGDVHLFTRDSIYQIDCFEDNIQFPFVYHRDEMSANLINLRIVDRDRFFFRDKYGNGQLNTYTVIDTLIKETDTLAQVYNKELFTRYRIAKGRKKSKLKGPDLEEQRQMSKNAGEVRKMRGEFVEASYNNKIRYQNIATQIVKWNDEYLILDITNREIIHYSSDLIHFRTNDLVIPEHNQRQKLFVQDMETEKIYWVYYKGNRVVLLELNPDKGIIVDEIETPSLPFIEKIKIKNGVIWFLCQTRRGEDVRSLYRWE